MADQFTDEYSAYQQLLSKTNPTRAVLFEPRAYFNFFQLNGTQEVPGAPGVFRNGEDFPVFITHLTAAVTMRNQANSADLDERLLQRVGLYLNFHDQYYMNAPQQLGGGGSGSVIQASPIPTWSNVPSGGPEALTRGTSSWRFDKGCVLSTRDSLKVRARLYSIPGAAVPITVSFTGAGLITHQPYFFSGTVQPTDLGWVEFDVTNFANDGSEPVMLTDMVVQVQAEIDDVDPTGDSRRAYISVRQVGNGTGADWFRGPVNMTTPGVGDLIPNDAVPAVLLGPKSGRSLVHLFPQPLVWEPGDGITATMQALIASAGSTVNVNLGLLGFIAVQ
jgi:hypothetical protein